MILFVLFWTVALSEPIFLLGFRSFISFTDTSDLYQFSPKTGALTPWRTGHSNGAKTALYNQSHVLFVDAAKDAVALGNLFTQSNSTDEIKVSNISCLQSSTCINNVFGDGECICDGSVKIKSSQDSIYIIKKMNVTHHLLYPIKGTGPTVTIRYSNFKDAQIIYSEQRQRVWVLLMTNFGFGQKDNVYIYSSGFDGSNSSTIIAPVLTQKPDTSGVEFYKNGFYWIAPSPNGSYWNIYVYNTDLDSKAVGIFVTNLTIPNSDMFIIHTPNNTKCTYIFANPQNTNLITPDEFWLVISFVSSTTAYTKLVKVDLTGLVTENNTSPTLQNGKVNGANTKTSILPAPWENFIFTSSNTIFSITKFETQTNTPSPNIMTRTSEGKRHVVTFVLCVIMIINLIY